MTSVLETSEKSAVSQDLETNLDSLQEGIAKSVSDENLNQEISPVPPNIEGDPQDLVADSHDTNTTVGKSHKTHQHFHT